MVSSSDNKKLANVVGAKSARACDSCVRKRARWFCAADDAFLCQSCDSSVHSANPLARRHERVRLKSTSINSFDEARSKVEISWHEGFTRKARTPRQKKKSHVASNSQINSTLHLVPEIFGDEYLHDENEEQLLYRVPVFNPLADELCSTTVTNSNYAENDKRESKDVCFNQDMGHLQGFLPSEMELAEFAADVESLLGKGLDDESFGMEGLGILDYEEERKDCCVLGSESVKVEDAELGENVEHGLDDSELMIDLGRETFELDFDYDSPSNFEDDHVSKVENGEQTMVMNSFDGSQKKPFLRLDFEGVLSSWDGLKSPWTTGERPDMESQECWPDCLGACGTMDACRDDMEMMSEQARAMAAEEREARVTRYREKRRTRLFSKKIRYEVRKLNAEMRPRMKGRFVKRANLHV